MSQLKYLDLIKALQESGRLKEKQRIENEVQTGAIDPNEKVVIKTIIQNMYNWFSKTKGDDAQESWEDFLTKMRKKVDKDYLPCSKTPITLQIAIEYAYKK